MCDPATVAMTQFGLVIGRNALAYQQAQVNFETNQCIASANFNFQTAALNERKSQEAQAFSFRDAQLQTRTVEEQGKASSVQLNLSRKGAVAKAKAKGSATQRGSTGITAEAIARDVERKNLEQLNVAAQDANAIERNLQTQNIVNIQKYQFLTEQLARQEEKIGLEFESNKARVNRPNPLSLLFGAADSGLGAAGTYYNMGGRVNDTSTTVQG